MCWAKSARPVEELRAEVVSLSEEEFDKALEKLEIHGGARVDFGGNVTARRARDGRKLTQCKRNIAQSRSKKCVRFTASSECRMAALVRHFGDEEDASRPCGKCDVCDPAGAVLRLFRRATNGGEANGASNCRRASVGGVQGGGDVAERLDAAGRCEPRRI